MYSRSSGLPLRVVSYKQRELTTVGGFGKYTRSIGSTLRVVLYKHRKLTRRTWLVYTDNRLNMKSCIIQTTRVDQADLVRLHGHSPQHQRCFLLTTQIDQTNCVITHSQSSQLVLYKRREFARRVGYAYTFNRIIFKCCFVRITQVNYMRTQ